MTSTVSSINPREAIARINDFENQVRRFQEDPVNLTKVFCQTTIEDVPETTPTRDLHKRFKITTESQPLGSEMIKRVQQAMEATVKAAKTISLSPDDAALVCAFERHLTTFNKMQEFAAHRAEQSVPITPPKTLTVTEVKRQLNPRKIAFDSKIPENFLPGFLLSSFPGLLIAAFVGLESPFIWFATAWFVVVGMLFLVRIIIGIRADFRDARAFKEATTPEQLLPVLFKVNDRVRVKFLIQLGPDFRRQYLKEYKQKFGYIPFYISRGCACADTLQSNEVPKDLKETALQELRADQHWYAKMMAKQLQKAGLVPLS